MASRIDSASSRRRSNRQSQVLSGSGGALVVIGPAGELVGRREHDLAVNRLDRPAARRRTGRRASRAARGGSAARRGRRSSTASRRSPAEVVLPDPVDHHAGRQRVARAGSAIGQLEPAAGCRGAAAAGPGQERRDTVRDDRARAVGLAPALERRRRSAGPRSRRSPRQARRQRGRGFSRASSAF